MRIAYTEEQNALRKELQEYFGALMPEEVRDRLGPMEGGPEVRKIIRKMGQDRWLGVGWPTEYGGQGRSWIEQQIWFDEARNFSAPIPFVTLNTVGPALMVLGTQEQKNFYLPKILDGEIQFAIGYSEPEAGTDLAALNTSAVRDGDHYIVNGTKMFTSGADDADYIWLAVRTDPEAKKHKGISILIVDAKSEGFSSARIETINGGHTNMSYYQDVRVPVENLVGPENGGWGAITLQLNHERVGLAAFSNAAVRLLEGVIDWAKRTSAPEGGRVADRAWVQMTLAEAHALCEAMKILNWKMVWEMEDGDPSPAGSSAIKVFGTEAVIDVYRLMLEVLGEIGTLRPGSPGAVLRGRIEQEVRGATINTYGGGVNEIQREIVAMLGLHMPRAMR